ncbi:MAG: LVIVD repeat protein [Parcubacteria bacterium OLB19]|nr:MAG: LVIVD repeat protein [Parcubacteria bacterium OLB19]
MEVVYCKIYKETATKITKRFLLLFCLIFIFSFQLVNQVDAATITVSGTLYTDEGVTTAGSGKTIKVAVGTSTPSVHSTTTASDGTWQITNIDDASLSTSTPFSVWLDGDANDATTLVMGYSGSNITGIPLYYAYTLANATSSTATINVGSFAFYDSGDDSDILYLVTSTSTTINSNLLIKQGIFSAPTTTLSISGNYKNNGTLSNNYGSIFLTGVSKTIDGSLTGSNAFYNLNISGSYTISTTSASTTNVLIKNTGSLVAPQNLTVSGNFSNAGTFDSNSGNLYLNNDRSEVMSYVVGRDANGYSLGTSSLAVNALASKDSYLYVGKAGNGTACSSTVSLASGCELMVYDNSSSTNPTYVTGMDVNGLNAGTSTVNINSLYVSGNYLYVGKAGNGTACSQTAGSASGCELMVFDISSSTNPTYVAGMDTNGLKNGTSSQGIFQSIVVSGNYLYAARSANSTACSQTAGSAEGCELHVYDISSSTNPVYKAGRDSGTTSNGTGNSAYSKLRINNNYLYVGKAGNVNNCSSSAIGCELQIYDVSSSTNPTYVAGRDVDGTNSGVTSVTINDIFINEDFIYVAKAASTTACSQASGSANGCELMVFDISSSTNPTYVAGRDSDSSSDGVTAVAMNSLIVYDGYLYIAKSSAGLCSQSALYALGCELMVFDISSSTNPVYVEGQDASGMNDGSTSSGFNVLQIVNNSLSVGKTNSATACAQSGSNATGCELMIFNLPKGSIVGNLTSGSSLANLTLGGATQIVSIASTTDLTTQTNSTSTIYDDLTISSNYTNNSVSIFNPNKYLYFNSDSAQTISGTMVGTSSLPKVVFSGTGTKTLNNNASTTDFSNLSGSSVVAPSAMTALGDYTNNGNFDHNNGLVDIRYKIVDYLTARDSSGNSTSTGASVFNSLVVSGNYIYVGKGANSTACSQTAGSALGCELMVFDISSSTNPTYVAGRDATGDNSGVSTVGVNSLFVYNTFLYIGKYASTTACSQTAGSASGCEMMVFDISSSTNPIYVAGRDASGNDNGTGAVGMSAWIVSGNYLYVGKGSDTTACSQTAGSAIGCELQVYDISSSTNPVYVAGRDILGNDSGTGGGVLYGMIVRDSYLTTIGGSGTTTACSQTAGSAGGCELQVYDISSSTNPTYVAGRDASGSGDGVNPSYFLVMLQITIIYI